MRDITNRRLRATVQYWQWQIKKKRPVWIKKKKEKDLRVSPDL